MTIVIHDIQDENWIIRQTTIKTRQKYLFYLQRKIYQASKECNNQLVHSLQKLLISLKSIRTLAQDILSSQKSQSRGKNRELIRLNQNDIDEVLIMWCLEAEWHAKIKECYISRSNISAKLKLSLHLVLNPFSLQNIDNIYLIKKLQSIKWINDRVKCYLLKNLFVQERLQGPIKYKNTLKYNLVNLLYSIMFLGMEWTYYQQQLYCRIKKKVIAELLHSNIYIFNYNVKQDIINKLTVKSFLYNLGILNNYSIDVNNNNNLQKNINLVKFNQANSSVRELILSIKSAMYNKDYLGRYRISPKNCYDSTLSYIYKIFISWSSYYKSIARNTDYISLFYIINEIITVWIKKSNQSLNCNIIGKIESKLCASNY
uniref:Reverse transcriptase N-terminal domain-containing protein n=1 Tax=Helminthora furcellata TaxID=1884666 RepID=A0A1G4NZ73_9FLOR|nr:Hypothetical protein ORF_3 [Helminthora furcellata]SCW21123.1 Hypothetical protein ORF_3 [Helminthora furcellata]SCW23983.1 Hypothetical protein ORF_3 [Helminthora furcellata]